MTEFLNDMNKTRQESKLSVILFITILNNVRVWKVKWKLRVQKRYARIVKLGSRSSLPTPREHGVKIYLDSINNVFFPNLKFNVLGNIITLDYIQ